VRDAVVSWTTIIERSASSAVTPSGSASTSLFALKITLWRRSMRLSRRAHHRQIPQSSS
jgi:hypothetical protein